MTQTTLRPAALRPRRTFHDNYDDVTDMLVALHALPSESPEYAKQRERIFDRCLPLADRVASHFARRGVAHDELTQVARLGLVNAVNRFDPAKGMHFIGFAVPTMMGEVRRYFRDYCWGVRVPRRLREIHVSIGQATPPLTQRLGRAPTATELADALGMPREDIIEALVAGESYGPASLDAPQVTEADSPQSMAEQIGSLDSQLEHIDDRLSLNAVMETLPERERQVLYMRFFESLSQSQIGERIGCSQMQVSRILAQTLKTLRDRLE